ncbi:hypothetical protein [Robertkochia aurantiaca]|uniref:hypothetical protein n=1 Tax=Robertkochia aurantiaca TaxID=2873700 RepID=UPI001CCAE668|nr:hypothetical protein [Robertkochia sp. 3YJGBD-33]
MKIFLKILFISIVVAGCVGYYFKFREDHLTGDRIIGIAVLAFSFLLMPLFIFHRSKGKQLKDYTFTKENLDRMNEKKNKNQ